MGYRCEGEIMVFGQVWASSVQSIVQQIIAAFDFFVELLVEHLSLPQFGTAFVDF